MNNTEEKAYIVWDTCEIAENHAKFLMEEEDFTEQEAYEAACNNSFLYDDEWELTCDDLTEVMKEMNPDSHAWYAEASGMGWLKQEGFKKFKAKDGEELLGEILPKTDCTFWIYKREKDGGPYMEISNTHHDAPVRGQEVYFIYPARTCLICGDVLTLEEQKTPNEDEIVCESCLARHYD